ncbi:SpoIIE family protein phosphatase [Nonomuraea dietziae]|uniref:Serine phosphatase RsbU (Regulator of sigma subunit) n=1 Tax=Nonomuraea dietziae TaxID=65515 RepID=A0A7W5YDK9_9ACTN|nr:SpoIIE family protein phosphatase [Nonomuraea dietziae]MBB3730583.1 serine phosphatase RsbU (regulator of sigma subunit) [Nonomuraea dietziae]
MTAHGLPEMPPLLLIEDDAGDAFLVEELLQEVEKPPTITWARSIAEARQRFNRDIQCVLVDLSLPDADGMEALREVLAMAPDVAVLVLTGLNDAHVGIAAVAEGAEDFLVKQDVDARLLARAIRYAIERKRADLAHQRLIQSELTSRENTRLEYGLLPVPLLPQGPVAHQCRYLPGRQRSLLAGDFYDTVQGSDGAIHTVIGDVCGHGPDEAALGVALRIAWRTLTLAGIHGDEALQTLDTVLKHERRSPEIFTTLCTATIDPSLRHATMHLVGHPPPVLIREGRLDVVRGGPSGPPLGIFPDVAWRAIDVPLGEEWSMLLYTDGLTEATVGGGPDLLGTDGLLRIIDEHGGIDLDRIIDRVTEINREALSDDLAAVLISRKG